MVRTDPGTLSEKLLSHESIGLAIGNRRLPDLARAFTDGKEESQR
jgi:hypothetical protein